MKAVILRVDVSLIKTAGAAGCGGGDESWMSCFSGGWRSMLGGNGRRMRQWRLFVNCARTLPPAGRTFTRDEMNERR